jgi:hypothetical protein
MTGVMCVLAGTSGAPPLVLDVSASNASATSSISQSMVTGSVTVSIVSGGSGSYTYSWVVTGISGMSSCTPTNATSATTQFSCEGVQGVDSGGATGTCTVTDTGNGKTASISVGINASFTGIPP